MVHPKQEMVKIVLGLGSNAGNRMKFLRSAVKMICRAPGFAHIAHSGVYETEPWGYKEQRKFLNCVLVCLCRNSPAVSLKILKRIEISLGRKPGGKWQKREIDIDILFYGSRKYGKNGLKIPHPFIECRNFVLAPLAELMPEFVHPVRKRKIKYLLKHSPDTGKVNLISGRL